jgi:hypothetical protein
MFLKDVFVNLPTKYWAAPETVAPRDVPYWRNVYADLGSNASVSRFYENRTKVMDEVANSKRENKLGVEREYSPEEAALQSLGASAENYTEQMSKLRKQEIELALDEEATTREKMLGRRRLSIERADIAKEFNSQFVAEMDDVARK